jgi:hypothetical protein
VKSMSVNDGGQATLSDLKEGMEEEGRGCVEEGH